jgi:hypothetical protein
MNTREISSLNGGRSKASGGMDPGFKPGVRYFVLPNYRELDPPPVVQQKPRTVLDYVRDALRGQPQTQRELAARLPFDPYRIGGALYELQKRGDVTIVSERPREKVAYGRTVDKVYALKDRP